MQDYSHLGLDERLKSKNSLANRFVYTPALQFESLYEVKSDRLDVSKANLGEFIKLSGSGTALGTFSTSQALNLTSTLTYNTPKANVLTYGRPAVGIYQGAGTAAGSQIYPIRGTGVTLGRYDVIGGEIDYSNYNGTAVEWRGMIVDTNGTSSQVITFATRWLYTDYQTGNAT